MHDHDDSLRTYDSMKRFVLKYVRVLQGLRKSTKAKSVHMLTTHPGLSGHGGDDQGGDQEVDEEADFDQGIQEILSMQLSASETTAEINAFVARKGF